MGNKLSSAQLLQIRRVFDHFDINADGKITTAEFQVKLSLSRDEVMRLFKTWNLDTVDGVNFEQFIKLVEKKILIAFTAIDLDNSGTFTLEELKRAYNKAGVDLSEGEVVQYFNSLDINRDKVVTLEEFILGCFLELSSTAAKKPHSTRAY